MSSTTCIDTAFIRDSVARVTSLKCVTISAAWSSNLRRFLSSVLSSLLELLLAVLDLLDDRTGRRLDGGGEADVRLVDDTADAGIHLLVASLVERGELGEALFEGALDVDLEGRRSPAVARSMAGARSRSCSSSCDRALGRRPSRCGGAAISVDTWSLKLLSSRWTAAMTAA